jgi:hypothetical protein
VENAERLTFRDETFDYVFCKESFHHFPRPYLALYEMLRVARRAVFLVEPNDPSMGRLPKVNLTKSLFKSFLTDIPFALLKRLSGKDGAVRVADDRRSCGLVEAVLWEESGNYMYSFSRNEAEKVSLGLNLPQMVTKGINDHYIDGCEFEPADVKKSQIFRTIVESIEKANSRSIEGLQVYNLLMVGFFLEAMDLEVRSKFSKCGWEVIDLPRNPYVKTAAPTATP